MTNNKRTHEVHKYEDKEFSTKPRRFRLESLMISWGDKTGHFMIERVTGKKAREVLANSTSSGLFKGTDGVLPEYADYARVDAVMYRREYKGKCSRTGDEEPLSISNYFRMGKPEAFDIQTKYTVRKK